MATTPWAVERNLAATLRALDRAAKLGAQIAVTPECVLHGYAHRSTDPDGRKLRAAAEPVDGSRVSAIRAKAREHGMHVLAGFAERGSRGLLHNSAALISPAGRILHVYRKVHLRPFESIEHEGWFTPGKEFKVVPLKVGRATVRAGIMICFDREIPESVRCLRSLGAELVLCPLATFTWRMNSDENRAHNEMITRVRAAENEVFIAVINHAKRYNGGSFVVGPLGELLCQMGNNAGVRVVKIPVGALRTKYRAKPLGWMGWGHRRPAVYALHLRT